MGKTGKIRQKRNMASNSHSDSYIVPEGTSNNRRISYGNIEIEYHCSNPPWGVFRKLRTCLNRINKYHLQGLGKIILTDEIKSLTPDVDDAISNRGVYIYPTSDTPPIIMLAIPEFYKWIPWWLWWSPAITLRLCRTLAHEVGHHVAFMSDNKHKESESSERELIANNYADSVIESMTRHWYYKMGGLLIKYIADSYFGFGLAAAQYQRYQRAARRFYAAWDLDSKHKYAEEYYWRARNTCEKEAKKATTRKQKRTSP